MGSTYEIQSMIQEFEQAMGIGLVEAIFSEVPSMLISLAVYVFTALALHTIADRRGIKNPWLAWIPYANVWLLGCISDQYRSVARGQTKYRRRWLLFTEIANVVIGVLVIILVFVMLFNLLSFGFGNLENLENMNDTMGQELLSTIMGPAVGMVLLALVLIPIAIVHAVFTYIALYDIYYSCEPGNATLYLVLTILIPYTQPIFLFLCRNKDLGMPLRVTRQPEYMPPQEPDWSGAERATEPWEQKDL